MEGVPLPYDHDMALPYLSITKLQLTYKNRLSGTHEVDTTHQTIA